MSVSSVVKGDRYRAMGAQVEVRRVDKQGRWADVKVTQYNGASWTKRQPLPFPAEWKKQPPTSGVAWSPDWTIHPGVHWRELVDNSELSQVMIAERMGVSEKHLSQILTCKVMPGVEATVSFAEVIHAPVDLLWRLACDHRLALALGKTDLTAEYL